MDGKRLVSGFCPPPAGVQPPRCPAAALCPRRPPRSRLSARLCPARLPSGILLPRTAPGSRCHHTCEGTSSTSGMAAADCYMDQRLGEASTGTLMGICNVTWEHPGTATAPHKRREAGAAQRSPHKCSPHKRSPAPSTAPLAQDGAEGAACPPDRGISPQCANAVLSTAGLALSSALQASAAGASALGRGGDGAGPKLMQCQRDPGPADAAPLSTQDHGKHDKRCGGDGRGGEGQEVCPAPCAVPACVPAPSLGVPPAPHLRPTTAPTPRHEVRTRNLGSRGTAELPEAALALQDRSSFAQSYMIVETLSSGTQ